MSVEISDRELLNVVVYFRGQGAWGADTPDVALAIAEIHDVLSIDALDARAGEKAVLKDFDDAPKAYDLSAIAQQVLRSMLARKVIDNTIGRLGTQALRRIPAPGPGGNV